MFWGKTHHLRKHLRYSHLSFTTKGPLHLADAFQDLVNKNWLVVLSPTHSEKYASQIGFIFPNFRGEHKKNSWVATTQIRIIIIFCHFTAIFLLPFFLQPFPGPLGKRRCCSKKKLHPSPQTSVKSTCSAFCTSKGGSFWKDSGERNNILEDHGNCFLGKLW